MSFEVLEKQNGTINYFSADLNDCMSFLILCFNCGMYNVPCDCVSGDLLSYSYTRLVFH